MMQYPIVLTPVHRHIALYIPDPQQLQEAYAQRLIADPGTAFPFWAQVWPSSKAMMDFLMEEPGWIEGKQVLELGAGIGLPSFAVARSASHVIVSDHDAEAVRLLQWNGIQLGLSNVTAMCIDWNDLPSELSPDVVLLSDVNYAPNQFDALLEMIHFFLEKNAMIILATPQRITITPFAEALQAWIVHSELYCVEQLGMTVEIRLLVLMGEASTAK